MSSIIKLNTLSDTQNLAARLASNFEVGDMLALEGVLGAGKTTFARALLQKLGVTGEVPSPTFTLLQTYDLPRFPVYHFDLYRLKNADELDELGWDDACAAGFTVVEWPERAGSRLPVDYLKLTFALGDQGSRICMPEPYGGWKQRWKDMA